MKRLFDIIIAAISLVLLSPVLLIIMVLIKFDSKGPVIFGQRRVGVNDQEFTMYKFRTMVVGTPEVATDKLINGEKYITKIGYYLRKYSLDELPQLVNILAGEMSFVGPRPALYNQYDLRQMRNMLAVSSLRPGLTGWAQINGRDEISLQQKVAQDSFYLQNRSLMMDLRIMYRTIFSVYSGNGVCVRFSKYI